MTSNKRLFFRLALLSQPPDVQIRVGVVSALFLLLSLPFGSELRLFGVGGQLMDPRAGVP